MRVLLLLGLGLSSAGSNGFSDSQQSWDESASLQTADPGPGQTLQATTYSATGIVIVTYCRHDPFLGGCGEPPQDYVEQGGPIQAVVQPIPAPQISSVSPAVATVGTVVEVTGTHFGASGMLTFNGAAATTWSWTSTRIEAFVPVEATSGPVVVTILRGSLRRWASGAYSTRFTSLLNQPSC